jgi:hypothetical protein
MRDEPLLHAAIDRQNRRDKARADKIDYGTPANQAG